MWKILQQVRLSSLLHQKPVDLFEAQLEKLRQFFFGIVLMDNRGLSQRCLIFISRLWLIITLYLSILIAKNCKQGVRHRKPDSKTGFKAVFFDLFVACGQLLWQTC